MNVQLKGALKRAKLEHKYMTTDWTIEEMGKFWDTIKDYDEIDDETYAYKRRFYDSLALSSLKDDRKPGQHTTSLKNKGRILDVDCRTGNGTVFYHKNGKVKEAVCLSPSKVFLMIAKDRLKKYKIKAETKLFRDIHMSSLKPESFDLILCMETIEHIPQKDRHPFLKGLNRVLAKEGILILTMPNRLWEPVHWLVAIFGIHHSEGPHRFLSRRKIVKYLNLADFHIKRERTTVLIPYGPRWLTKIGEFKEKLLSPLMRFFGLRRIFICEKGTIIYSAATKM